MGHLVLTGRSSLALYALMRTSARAAAMVLGAVLLEGGSAMALTITSTSFASQQEIPVKHTCEGGDA